MHEHMLMSVSHIHVLAANVVQHMAIINQRQDSVKISFETCVL